MIITCPKCHTRYQVAASMIGAAGRKVQCAACRQSWQARAESYVSQHQGMTAQSAADLVDASDQLFDAEAEQALDAAFSAVERETYGRVGYSPRRSVNFDQTSDLDISLDPAAQRRRKRAMARREKLSWYNRIPGRYRHILKLAGVVFVLSALTAGFFWREDVVRFLPGTEAAYALLGMGVNGAGLAFDAVTSTRRERDGSDFMLVSATIRNVSEGELEIPPIRITLLDASGREVRQWVARAPTQMLPPGAESRFESEIDAPPETAVQAKLQFSSETVPDTQEQS